MEPSVVEYVLAEIADPLIDIYAPLIALRESQLNLLAALAVSVAVIVAVHRERAQRSAVWEMAWATLMLFATYTQTWGHIDEVSINLEHAYNLYHFGRFSFSPAQMVDGTVEYAYYLLLTPFGASPGSLVMANFWLGFVLSWLHLVVLRSMFADHQALTRLCLLLLFAVNYPVVSMLSSGFGASLLSLAFVVSLYLHFAGKTTAATLVAVALPLLRPDAVLYSYALLFAMSSRRDFASRPFLLLRWSAPAMALAVYLVGIRAVYGHWIPTPIAFKSVHPSLITLDELKYAAIMMMGELGRPPYVLALVAVAASTWFRDDPRIAVTRRLLLPTAALFVFYEVSRAVFVDYSGDNFGRYWIGFSHALFLCLLLVLASVAAVLERSGARAAYHMVFGRFVPVVVCVFTMTFVSWTYDRDTVTNRTTLVRAGQIIDTVLPPDLTVSTTELSTFGLMLRRHEIIDLWGYTNPRIAQARMVNGIGIRNDPEFFLATRPDVYFAYGEPEPSQMPEDFLGQFKHFSKPFNMLGDMHRVLDAYDVVIVNHPERHIFLLVRRGAREVFHRSLLAHGYRQAGSRPLNRPDFARQYDTQPLRQRRF